MGDQVFSNKDTGVVVVDVQADFTELKSGTLAVPGTDIQYVEAVETATRHFLQQGLPVYYTQDWHPADHVSFFTNNPDTEPLQVIDIDGRPQVMWPPHCVRDSVGAEFHSDLDLGGVSEVVRKGVDPDIDSYSAFFDNARLRSTGLERLLR